MALGQPGLCRLVVVYGTDKEMENIMLYTLGVIVLYYTVWK